MNASRFLLAWASCGAVAAGVVAAEPPAPSPAADSALPAPRRVEPATADAAAPVREFASAAEAVQALVRAFEANDDEALRALLGTDAADLVQSGEDPAVRPQRAELAAAARARTAFETRADGRVTVLVGAMQHPLAIPLSSNGGRWRFDAAAGRQELLARRIGENEIDAVGLCLAYVQAQREYAASDRDGDGVLEYAQRVVSSEGRRDGLYWEAEGEDDPSPAGTELAPFREALGPVAERRAPFGGYWWRVLTRPGASPPAGSATTWLRGEDMVGGFALLAVPAVHRNTGVQSFLVGPDGRVLQKDLGPDTLDVAAKIEAYEPDASWTPVDARTLRVAAESAPGTLLPAPAPGAVGGPRVTVGGCPR